jgi:rhomboid protease GluP
VSDSHPDWIDKVARLAGHLGMNATQVRWKLIRWHERRGRDRRRLEQTVDHIKYAHKTCGECGAVQDRDERTCSHCGARLGSRTFQVLRRLGLATPEALSVSTVLALVIMAAYARVWVAQGGGFATPTGWLLFDFGAHWEAGAPDEPWRLLTAMFLHIGVWHLAFNLIAIATIGPQVEEIWGRLTMLFVFIVTGIAGNLVSGLAQPGVLSAGASGGICGLIGAAAGFGHRLGTARGRTLRNDMLKWLAYTIVFGFALHANNYAHAGGALAGAAFGYRVRPAMWRKRALVPVRVVTKAIGVLATAGALAIILTRHPADHMDVGAAELGLRVDVQVCQLVHAGHPEEARVLLDTVFVPLGNFPLARTSDLDKMCAELQQLRTQCRLTMSRSHECAIYDRVLVDLPSVE